GKENDVRRLGQHPGQATPNRVRRVAFIGPGELISAAQDGSVVQWNLERSPVVPVTLFRFELLGARPPNLFRVAVSPDKQWLAGVGEKNVVEVRRRDGRPLPGIEPLPKGHFPHSLAFDPRGERLAVGVRIVPSSAQFYQEADGQVLIYDLHQRPPQIMPGPK